MLDIFFCEVMIFFFRESILMLNKFSFSSFSFRFKHHFSAMSLSNKLSIRDLDLKDKRVLIR